MTQHLYRQSLQPLFDGDKLLDPLKDPRDKNKLINSLRQMKGFSKQHIQSFNQLIDFKLQEIITAKNNRRVLSEADPDFYLQYERIHVAKPTFQNRYDMWSDANELHPNDARMADLTYAGDIFVDIKYFFNGVLETRSNIKIGRMPIMLGSKCCHLYGKSEKQLAMLKECPLDPKGYFIIKGAEKVLLIQEQMIENRILVEKNVKMDTIIAGVTSYTIDTKSVCGLLLKKGKIYLKFASFTENIPLFVLFKALGIECQQQVFQLIDCTDNQLLQILVLSLQDAHSKEVFTTQDALEYMAKKLVKKKFEVKQERDPVEEVREMLANILLAHIPIRNYDFYPKTIFVALMTKRLIEGSRDPSKLDNRDYYGNKRMKCAGQLLELMFQQKFKVLNAELKKELGKFLPKNKNVKKVELKRLFQTNTGIITNGLQMAIASGNWTIKRFNMDRKGVSQQLSRFSYISALGMMTRISSQFQKTRKIAGPRALLGSHWGMICPCDTPDGESCGLVKNLALTTCITTSSPALKLSSLAVQDYAIVGNRGHRVTVNGRIIGYTPNTSIIDRVRLMRRKGLIDKYVNIALAKAQNDIYGQIMINMDAGRLVRPLIILDKGRPLLTPQMVKGIADESLTFQKLIERGAIEFVDVNEEDNCLIALKPSDISMNHTHVQIDPMTIIGCVAGLIPYPHHNQSPRNIYQCSMGKQAQGIIALNQLIRLDTINYLLVYPQKPLVKTAHIELTNYEKLPAGHNASVAVMSYSGYDIEDAVMVNKAALDRGFGRSMYYRRYETQLKKYVVFKDRLMPQRAEVEAQGKLKGTINKRLHAIDESGLAKVGVPLRDRDIYVNKKVPIIPAEAYSKGKMLELHEQNLLWKDEPSVFKGNRPMYVDRMVVSEQNDTTTIKTVFREMRRPELGDKFSSRHGQKGVCGLIIPQEDMPFSETGWRPDLIMNPHGYPSRMTVGKLLQLVGSKAGALQGQQKYGTAFGGDKIEDLGKILLSHGFSYTGKDALISGITGQYLNCYVFCGPIFYQRLKHMVADKIHARSKGRVNNLTRQPTEGRSKEGGLRLGEMERDCLLGFGATDLLLERLLISSDISSILVCQKCGLFQHKTFCDTCRSHSTYKISIPYACKLLFQQLLAMGIKPKINLSKITKNPYEFEMPA